MSLAKCNKCGSTLFQSEVIMPVGSDREILSIICNSCNAMLGATEYYSTEKGLEILTEEFKQVNKKMDVMNANLGQLMNAIKLIYKKIEDTED